MIHNIQCEICKQKTSLGAQADEVVAAGMKFVCFRCTRWYVSCCNKDKADYNLNHRHHIMGDFYSEQDIGVIFDALERHGVLQKMTLNRLSGKDTHYGWIYDLQGRIFISKVRDDK